MDLTVASVVEQSKMQASDCRAGCQVAKIQSVAAGDNMMRQFFVNSQKSGRSRHGTVSGQDDDIIAIVPEREDESHPVGGNKYQPDAGSHFGGESVSLSRSQCRRRGALSDEPNLDGQLRRCRVHLAALLSCPLRQ